MIARIAQIARFEQRCLEKSSHKFVTIERYVLLRTYNWRGKYNIEVEENIENFGGAIRYLLLSKI